MLWRAGRRTGASAARRQRPDRYRRHLGDVGHIGRERRTNRARRVASGGRRRSRGRLATLPRRRSLRCLAQRCRRLARRRQALRRPVSCAGGHGDRRRCRRCDRRRCQADDRVAARDRLRCPRHGRRLVAGTHGHRHAGALRQRADAGRRDASARRVMGGRRRGSLRVGGWRCAWADGDIGGRAGGHRIDRGRSTPVMHRRRPCGAGEIRSGTGARLAAAGSRRHQGADGTARRRRRGRGFLPSDRRAAPQTGGPHARPDGRRRDRPIFCTRYRTGGTGECVARESVRAGQPPGR